METVRKGFISLILSYKVSKKTYFLCCTANQVDTGHKLHFQPKNPVEDKMAEINNKNGCGTAKVWCRQFRSVSYNWYYHIRSGKIQLCSVVPPTKSAQAISSIFSPKIQLGPNWQKSTKKWLWQGWGVMQTVWKYFISLILSCKVRIRQLWSVLPPTKLEQATSSISAQKSS